MKTIFLLLSAMIVGVSVSFGQDRIYWGNQDADNIGSVNASDLGSALFPASVQNPNGIAYYHARPAYNLFYTYAYSISQDDLAGNSQSIITTAGQFNRGLAIDYAGQKIYWADDQAGHIGRADLDGGNKDESFISGLDNPWDIEIDPVNGKIYWTEDVADGNIKRANLSDGSDVKTVISHIQSIGVAVDPLRNKIYYTEFSGSPEVYAANLDGTGAGAITGLTALADIDVDFTTGKLYMVDYSADLLTMADPDGGNKSSVSAHGVFIAYGDVTIPVITSIEKHSPDGNIDQGGSATFRVTFSEPVLNVDATDFQLVGTPTGTVTVNPVSLNMVYDVVVTGITGTGTLDLDIASTHDLFDFHGNAFDGAISMFETFTVVATPAPSVTSFDPLAGPVGTSVVITGTGFSATPANNAVTFNGVTATVTASTSTSITTTVPVSATTGPIAVTTSVGTGTSATDFTVECTAPAKPTISAEGGLLTSSSSTDNQWLKNGVEIAGATGTTYSATAPGAYSVRVSSGDCSTESDETTIVGAEELVLSPIAVYPNPAKSVVRVEWKSSVSVAKVDIYTMTGVKKGTIELTGREGGEGRSSAEFDVRHYPEGMYVIILTSPDATVTRKLQKR